MNDLTPPSQDVMDTMAQSVTERINAEKRKEDLPKLELGIIAELMLHTHPDDLDRVISGLSDAIMDIAVASYLLGRNAGKVIQLSEDAKMVQNG